MKLATTTRLSLRKLFIAMLAVGPMAVLPSPVWAVLPTYTAGATSGNSFTVTNGSVTVNQFGSTATINFSDKAILDWGTTVGTAAAPYFGVTDGNINNSITNFVIGSGETYNFASSGSVLNKVHMGNNATNGSLGGVRAAAIINGTLQGTNARVFVLANGNITVGNGAQLNTQSLILSTLVEPSDGVFITLGDLSSLSPTSGSPTAQGDISLGSGLTIAGNLTAVAGNLTAAGSGTVSGDLVLRSITSTGPIALALGGTLAVNGNLSVQTNAGAISQTNPITVGVIGTGTQTATFNATTSSVTLANNGNDFEVVSAVATGSTSDLILRDANIVTLGASTIGRDLSVTVGGKTNTTGIGTSGAVSVGGNATLISASSANSSINLANGSTVAGYVSGVTAGGSVTINTTGNQTLGNITTNTTAVGLNGIGYLNVDSVSVTNGGAGFTSAPAVTFTAPPAGGTAPTATAVLSGGTTGYITGITINTPGSGYISAPNVTITASVSTTAAAATAAGTALAGVATTLGGVVSGASLTAGTTAPIYTGNVTASFTSPTARGSAQVGVNTITVSNGGTGYTSAPVVTFSAPPSGGTAPTATATVSAGGVITGLTVTGNGSGYTSVPSVTLTGGGGSGASVAPTLLLTGLRLSNVGSGYTGAPAVTIVGGGGAGATATATFAGDTVTALNLGVAGGLYTSIPTVVVDVPVPGATAATGRAVRDGATGLVTSIEITNGGFGYGATLPTVSFVGVDTGNNYSSGGITGTTTGALNTAVAGLGTNPLSGITTGNGLLSGQGVSLTGGSITTSSQIIGAGNASTSFTSTAGGISLTTNTITGNRISMSATGGNITQDSAAVITTSNSTSALSLSAPGGTITLDAAANSFAGSNNLTGNGSSSPIQVTAANASIRSIKNIILGTANVTGNLTLNSTASNNSVLLGTGIGIGVGQNIVIGGSLAVNTVGSGAISDNSYSALNVFGSVNVTSASAWTALTGFTGVGSGAITLNASTSVAAPSARYGQLNTVTSGAVTLAEVTTLNLGNITGGSLAATSTTGGIVDSGNITLTGAGTFTVNSTNTVVLDGTNNVIPTLNIVGGNENSITSLNADVTLGAATALTGNLTVGTASGKSIAIGGINVTGNVTVNSGNWIDVVGAANITGNLSLNATGNIANAGTTTLIGSAATFGSVYAANATINNTVGTVTGIGISNLPLLTFSTVPTVTVQAQPGAPGVPVAATVTANLSSNGQITGFNVTTGGSGYNTGLPTAPSVTISGATNTSITESSGTLNVTGTTSISSVGNALLWRANDFGNVVLNNSTGGAVINDVNNLTVSGSALLGVTARAGVSGSGTVGSGLPAGAPVQEANAWSLTLGNLNVGSLTAIASNGGGGNSGTLSQASGTSIHSENQASFSTNNNTITVGNNGNSFGRVELNSSPGGSINIVLVEDGTLKLGNVSGRGNMTLTSRFGNIIEDPTADVVVSNNGTLTASAANGSILIGNTTHTAGSTTGNIVTFNATAPNGQVAVTSNNSTTLGNINANSLIVGVTGGNGNITQSGSIKTFGSANFSASRNITLGNNTNNFGRIYAATSNNSSNIQITEGGTLNLGNVSMPGGSTGNFTATSVAGDIIDTGLQGVKLGGNITNVNGVPTINTGTGVVTLSATAGNIVLDDSTTEFPTTGGVVFNANNVTLAPLGLSAIYLGALGNTAVATGNLSVISATGNIFNAGAVQVTGDAFFQSGNGDIMMTNTANKFGTVRFAGKIVRITESDDVTLVTGSSASSIAEFVSTGGNISIVNRGGGAVTLGSTGLFSASGSITLPKLIQAADTLTLTAAGTKDLSALSLSGDLSGKTPVIVGTGTYLAPQP